jgi:DNA invertase Pin-like site-specific DNA recombinase
MEKQYVTYFRVSTKKQGESGLGLDAQRTYVNHFYGDRPIIAEFTDIESGKNVDNRPELMKAVALCKEKNATLVVAKIDRLSRNTEQALAIYRELNGRLVSCDIPNLDKFTLTLFMAIADRERELVSIRTKQALDEKVKQKGEWRTGSSPFKDGSATSKATGIRIAIAEDNQNNRRASALISQLKQAGVTWTAIADQLNSNGFKTSNGKEFQVVQVQRIHKRSRNHSEKSQ